MRMPGEAKLAPCKHKVFRLRKWTRKASPLTSLKMTNLGVINSLKITALTS